MKFKIVHSVIKLLVIVFSLCYFVFICQTKSILGHSFAIVVGNSMYPTLKDSNFLVVKNNQEVEMGDIICFFDEENRRIVHRVIDIDDDEITTKGDFNKANDKPINKTQIIGKVVFKSAMLGFVFSNLHIVLICLCVYVFFELKNLDKCDKMYI